MAKIRNLKAFRGEAKEKEKSYDWLAAADFYEKASSFALGKKDFKVGEIRERIGYCFYRAAFQAQGQGEFRRHMQLAVEAYEKAAELFKRVKKAKRSSAKILHCKAMVAYIGHWLSPEPDAKRELLDKCWRLEKEALKAYDEAGDQLGFGKTCVGLTDCLVDRLDLELDTRMREKILDEGLSLGEKAIQIFSKAGEEHELARAYCNSGIHCYNAAMSLQLETKRRECEQKAFDYAKNAVRISKSTGDKLLLGRSTVLLGIVEQDLGAGSEAASELFKNALQYSIEAKDHRIVSETFDSLAYSTYWSMIFEDDLEKMREKSTKCEEYVRKAIGCSILADHGLRIPHSYSFGFTANFRDLARREIKLEKRHKLLKKAVALGKQGLEHAQRTGSTHEIFHVSTELVHALYYISTMKTGVEKRQLLKESMTLAEKAVYYTEQLRPNFMWPQVLAYEALALILLELSKLEERKEKRKELLEKSVSRMETCITFFRRHVTSARAPSRKVFFALLGRIQTELGNVLNQLYQMTSEKEVLRKLIETYRSSVQMNKKADLVSRVAEAYWQTAVAYDRLGEYLESARNFESASKQYELSAHNIPQLNSFYMDYATYMQAWSNIEKARHSHEREEYASSEEYYDKAANYLQSSTLWNYLALNYSAGSLLEHAEHLSRQEKNQESMQVFQRAAEMFNEAKKSLETAWSKIVDPYEKEKVSEISRACDGRREYCLGRVSVEKARVFDREGDYESSAKRYGSAAKAFEKVLEGMEIKSDRRELQSIVYLCQAWQKMKLAEERLSPTLYAEASQLFMKAKESSLKKRTSLLAAGNSYFCKALEFGVKFKDTRNMELYSKTKQYMESASDCYTEAGFKKESFWVNATQVLFDSYVYMGKAETEVDPEKKLRLYLLAERFLDRSANLFERAGYLRKRNEVLRSVEKVKQKREFMLSLREVLSAPSIASSTSSISAPAPTHEEAVGLERFKQAYIQANLTIRPKEVNVGEDLGVEIKLVNIGKEPASLVKVEEILPPGFEPVAKPDYCRFEDAYVDMKGKKLNPLNPEEIRLVLRSFGKGTFAIKPRIVYVDETGHQMFCEPEPVTINVSEVILPGRITTGYRDLDNLLFGGIPRDYAVILTSPSCDEKDLLIKRFLETGAKQGEVTFYVTIDASEVTTLAEEFQPNFYLFICNPQADEIIKSLPNVFKLKGVENLTDINIALTSAFRRLDESLNGQRRACIEIISDVLLQHHAVQTRRWLTGLIPELKSRGFTTIAIMNFHMHSPQEVQAILGLFEGEINIYEKETEKGLEKFLKIKKMYNQRFLKSELSLRKERPET